jgi:hypothetical protein
LTFLKILGWIFVPYIMIFIQWKRLNVAVKVIGIVWSVMMLIGYTGFHGNSTPTTAPADNSGGVNKTAPTQTVPAATATPAAPIAATPAPVTATPTPQPVATPAPLKPVTLGTGTFYVGVGKDIAAGRYVVSTTGQAGNFFVYDGGMPVVNEILGTNSTMTVNNITIDLTNGEKIQISSLNAVKFTPKA